jgi:hypothetical protein
MKHENEKIPLSQLIKQQSQMSISISAPVYEALVKYCEKNKLNVEAYLDSIITKSINTVTSAK